MIAIFGLGNPGEKFKKTRHNLGFLILDKLQENGGFSDWQKNKAGICFYSWGVIAGQKIELIKPLTFMNDSGRTVAYVTKKHEINPEKIYIVHDDIDLPLGKIKISKSRGAAGHKGVESIINALKTKNFLRIRVGVQPLSGKPKNTEIFVVKNFSKSEQKTLQESVAATVNAITLIISLGISKAMEKFN